MENEKLLFLGIALILLLFVLVGVRALYKTINEFEIAKTNMLTNLIVFFCIGVHTSILILATIVAIRILIVVG